MLSELDRERIRGCRNEGEAKSLYPSIPRKTIREVRKSAKPDPDLLSKVAELFQRSGIDPADVRQAEKIRLNEWDMGVKNEAGEIETQRMSAVSLVLNNDLALEPEWPVVQQAAPVKIVYPPYTPPKKGPFNVATFISDPHIGFIRLSDGTIIPLHDERAMDITIQVIRELQPNLIINGGDGIDLAEWSMKFAQGPEFAGMTQMALDRAHRYLCDQKAAAPNAKIVYFEGNHSRRLSAAVLQNAQAALRLKQANVPEGWPVLSVPYLLRLDELGVEYVGGYPAAIYYLSDNLAAVHGTKSKAGKSTAAYVLDDERVSQLFGHIHRHELAMKTRRVRGGGRTILAQSFGCLCHIDGRVPSVKGAYDLMGRPIVSYENWQQGFGVIHYVEGDGPFDTENVFINDGMAIFRGKVYAGRA